MKTTKLNAIVIAFCMALFGLTGAMTPASAVSTQSVSAPCAATPAPTPSSSSSSASSSVETIPPATLTNGSGTEADPYLISSRADLEIFKSNPDLLAGCFYFKQTADIDLGDAPWIPIGYVGDDDDSQAFVGAYDGNGKSITNMQITSNQDFLGFFAYAIGAYVHDLNIEGSINPMGPSLRAPQVGLVDSNAPGYTDVAGGLAGALSGGRIENVTTNVSIINGRQAVGGLVGWLFDERLLENYIGDIGTIDDCNLLGDDILGDLFCFNLTSQSVNLDAESYRIYSNQIINSGSKGTISAGFNDGENVLDGESDVLGTVLDIVAFCSAVLITNSKYVIPESEARAVGGLVGAACGAHEVIGSTSSVDLNVTGDQSTAIGGLIGVSSAGVITKSTASGDVVLTPTEDPTPCFVAYPVGTSEVDSGWTFEDSDCSVRGDQDGIGAQYIGGLVGWDSYGVVTQSSASGKIDVSALPSRLVGGLIGLFGTEVIIGSGYYSGQCGSAPGLHDSFATGDVLGATPDEANPLRSSWYVGGLVGAANSNCLFIIPNASVLDNSYATGNVTGSVSVGGLLGISAFFKTLNNTYATGNVTSSSSSNNADLYGTGGLVGSMILGTVVSKSHASGAVSSTSSYTGGLIGSSLIGLAVSDSYATGSVSSVSPTYSEGVGGLIGTAGIDNQFTRVFATGNVSAISNGDVGNVSSAGVGGLIGLSEIGLTVNKAYATGSVASDGYATGGLIGYMCASGLGSCVLQNVYSRGDVSTTVNAAETGGLVGYAGESTQISIINAYTTSIVTAAGVNSGVPRLDAFANAESLPYYANSSTNFYNSAFGTSSKASGKTTAELKSAATYPSSWDFNSIWGLDTRATTNLVNDGYPYLREIVGVLPTIAPACAPVIMPKIGFAKNSAKLTKKSKAKLRTMAKQIAASNCTSIEITGYATKSKLATKRTNAVMTYLRGKLYNERYMVTMNLKKVHGKKMKMRRAEIALMS